MELVQNLKKKKKKYILLFVLLVLIISSATIYYNIKYYKGKKVVETLNSSWGMGTRVTEAASNNRDYEWYVNQLDTGKYGYQNCGPTSCQMVLKWVNKDSMVTAEEIREKFIPKNGNEPEHFGMSSSEVKRVFCEYGIKYDEISYKEPLFKDMAVESLKSGKILMMSLSMGKISPQQRPWHKVGAEFPGNYEHWVIIKGYKVVEGEIYFELYDPYGYKEGGKDRYYPLNEVTEAAGWRFIIDNGTKGVRSR